MESSGIYYLVKTIDGIRYKKSTRTTKLEEARNESERLEKQIRKLQAGGDYYKKVREATGVTDPSIKSLWDDFLEFKKDRVSADTIKIYRNAGRHIFGFWDKKRLTHFTQSEVEKWESWFIKNKNEMRYFNTRKSIVAFKNWLKKKNLIREHIEFDNLDRTILNRMNKREVHSKTYSQAEVSKLMSSECDICGLPVAIALTTGARKKEIITLKKDAIHENEEGILVIKFWSFKNKKFRNVPLPKKIKKRVMAQIGKNQKSEYLFPSIRDRAKPISQQVIASYFAILKEEIGLTERKTFHDLRRTFATMTAENGWPPVVACRILDMSLKIYDSVYTKPSPYSLKKFIDSVDIDKYSVESSEITGERDE